MKRAWISLPLLVWIVAGFSCGGEGLDGGEGGRAESCRMIEDGFGSEWKDAVKLSPVVTGLEVPWAIGFLPGGDWLVTERPGRVRRVKGGSTLEAEPVLEIETAEGAEGGLLGLAVHPEFSSNRWFYVYATVAGGNGNVNQLRRYRPDLSQNPSSPAGKLLRLNDDGSVPDDNPFEGSPTFLLGVRNTQGFDWMDSATLLFTDHGPSGELGRSGHDELNVASAGDNLGWPAQWRCDEASGRTAPLLVWQEALPPGGAAVYRGNRIAGWDGNFLISSLGSEHLQRVVLSRSGNQVRAEKNEVYFRGEHGRLREVIMGPDGHLYVTTSNCDGRGSCGAERDAILRLEPR